MKIFFTKYSTINYRDIDFRLKFRDLKTKNGRTERRKKLHNRVYEEATGKQLEQNIHTA